MECVMFEKFDRSMFMALMANSIINDNEFDLSALNNIKKISADFEKKARECCNSKMKPIPLFNFELW